MSKCENPNHVGDYTYKLNKSGECEEGCETCRAEAAESELRDVAYAIGSYRFMDSPDGGSVSLSEQVRRLREALIALDAAATALNTHRPDVSIAGHLAAWQMVFAAQDNARKALGGEE